MNYGNFIPELSPKKDSNLADLPVAVNYKRRRGNPEYFCGILFPHVRNHLDIVVIVQGSIACKTFHSFLQNKKFKGDQNETLKRDSRTWNTKSHYNFGSCRFPCCVFISFVFVRKSCILISDPDPIDHLN